MANLKIDQFEDLKIQILLKVIIEGRESKSFGGTPSLAHAQSHTRSGRAIRYKSALHTFPPLAGFPLLSLAHASTTFSALC
ncbi:MAG: hypothetical protein ACKVOQ_06930 [Cyclobacteriaceae bacterium]